MRHMNPVAEEAMSVVNSSDDSATVSVPTSWYGIIHEINLALSIYYVRLGDETKLLIHQHLIIWVKRVSVLQTEPNLNSPFLY